MTMTENRVTTLELAGDTVRRLSGVAVFASKEAERPILNAVKLDIEAGKITLTATDLYRLTMMTHEADDITGEGSYLVPASFLRDVAKATKVHAVRAAHAVVTLTLGERIEADIHDVYNRGSTFLVSPLVEGKYPEIMGIVEKWEPGDGVVSVSPHFLADYAKVFPWSEDKKSKAALVITPGKPNSPVRVTASSGDFVSYLMPIRIN